MSLKYLSPCLGVGRETRSVVGDKCGCPSLGLPGSRWGIGCQLVGYTSFPLGLPPASTLASASMLLENTFLTPLVRETSRISEALGWGGGLGTWAPPFSLHRVRGRDRFS